MATPGQLFYSTSRLVSFTPEEILEGRIIKINPALITLTDGRVAAGSLLALQALIRQQVDHLLQHPVYTFHLDINFPDYRGFGPVPPDFNAAVFSPAFVQDLGECIHAAGAYMNLHLLTDHPLQRLDPYEAAHPDAVCFQLDSVPEPRELNRLVDRVLSIGACASPVIETVGTGPRPPLPKERVRELLDPLFPKIGMLTVQAAETAARSNRPSGALAADSVHSYLECLKPGFHGTIQLQGGITMETIGSAVGAGAEFLVCGSQIFRNTLGLEPEAVIARLLREAALVLPARFPQR